VEAFHRLFSKDTTPIEQQKAMLAQKRSVLDAVVEEARDLKRGLGKRDNHKLEEYFQGVRDIETRLTKEEQWIGVQPPRAMNLEHWHSLSPKNTAPSS
jgi:hypothetical protein